MHLKQWVFWPVLYKQVKRYCHDCPEWQWMSDILPTQVPLVSLQLVEKPFNLIAMNIEGLFPRTNAVYQFMLVITDSTTRFPEAILLKSVTVSKIAEKLIKWVPRVGIP